jgi:hypothetical protein
MAILEAVNNDTIQHPDFYPGAVIRVDQPIRLRGVWDHVLDCMGSTVVYVGPPGIPGVVELSSTLHCTVKHLRIVDLSGAKSGVLISNQPGMVGASGCVLEDVAIRYQDGEPGPDFAFAIDSYALGGTDGNNDLHELRNCLSMNHRVAAVSMRGTQVHNIVLNRFSAVDYGNRYPVGILAERSGYFTLRDCNLGYCSTDIVCTGPEHRIVIDGFNGEKSRQFFRNSHAGAESFVNVKNVRWDGLPTDDGFVVDAFGTGPFAFENGYFAGIDGISPRMRFDHYSAGKKKMQGSLSMRGWQTVIHAETQSRKSDVIVPKEWNFSQFGCLHRQVGTNWSRRTMRVERPL